MGLFVYFAVPVICALLFRTILRQPTGTLFLEGLNAFLPQTSSMAPPPGVKTSKRERKLMQKRQLQLKGAQSSVVLQQLSTTALGHLSSEPSTFASNFEGLGTLLLVLFVGVVVHFTLGPLFGLWQDVLLYTLGPVVILWAACQLVVLECNGSLGRLLGGDRTRVVVVALAGFGAAFAMLVALPPGWIRWDVEVAAKQLDALFNGGMARLVAARMRHMPHVQPPPPLASQPHHVAVGLAAVAGLIATALLSPSARIAKLFHYISPTPHWAERYLEPHPLAAGAVRLALALPLAVVLYGIVPMVDYWGLPPAAAAAAGPALVAAAALAAVFAVRPLAGAHLGSGLMEWHLLRHDPSGGVAVGSGGSAGSSAAVAAAKEVVLRKRLNLVYATVCQVGLQLLAPAAILVCLALLYGAASGTLDSFRPPQPLVVNLGSKPLVLPAFKAPAARVAAPPPPPPPARAAAPAASGVELEGLDGLAAGAEDAAGFDPVGAPATAEGASVGADGEGQRELPPLPPLDFVAFAAGFLSWWSCLVLCLFTYPLMFVYRTGLHVG